MGRPKETKVIEKKNCMEVRLHVQRDQKGSLGAESTQVEWGKKHVVSDCFRGRDTIDSEFRENYQELRHQFLQKLKQVGKREMVFEDTEQATEKKRCLVSGVTNLTQGTSQPLGQSDKEQP